MDVGGVGLKKKKIPNNNNNNNNNNNKKKKKKKKKIQKAISSRVLSHTDVDSKKSSSLRPFQILDKGISPELLKSCI